jgi:hypothetical protein
MGRRRRRYQLRCEAVVADGPLGKFAATFYCRGNRMFQLVAIGPKVAASNPEELMEETEKALRKGFKGPAN